MSIEGFTLENSKWTTQIRPLSDSINPCLACHRGAQVESVMPLLSSIYTTLRASEGQLASLIWLCSGVHHWRSWSPHNLYSLGLTGHWGSFIHTGLYRAYSSLYSDAPPHHSEAEDTEAPLRPIYPDASLTHRQTIAQTLCWTRIFSLTLSIFQAIREAWQWSSPSPQPVQSVHCPVNPQGFGAGRVRILGISQRQTANWLHPLQISSLPWVGQPFHFFQNSWYIHLIAHYLERNSMASSFHFWHLIFQARLCKIASQLSYPNHQETLLALRPFTMYSEPNVIISSTNILLQVIITSHLEYCHRLCHRLNICVPLKLMCWNLMSEVMVLGWYLGWSNH